MASLPTVALYGNGTLFGLSGSILNGDYPPSISIQPVGGTAVWGPALRMTVLAGGTGTLNYQWRKKWIPV